MKSFEIITLLTLLLANGALSHGGKPSLSEDESHIKEHLKESTMVNTDAMTPEELDFHYFKLHDYDGNVKLDGLEMMKALLHNPHGPKTSDAVDLTPYESIIDKVLQEDDVNQDGYLSYEEYKLRTQGKGE